MDKYTIIYSRFYCNRMIYLALMIFCNILASTHSFSFPFQFFYPFFSIERRIGLFLFSFPHNMVSVLFYCKINKDVDWIMKKQQCELSE